MVGSVHNKTREGVGDSVNSFDFVTALVITRNGFQLTCVFSRNGITVAVCIYFLCI